MDNYLQGRTKAVWVSEKTGLVNDARRDWSDLGGNKDAILDFSKYKLGQPIADKQGVMFTTYDTLKMAKGGKSRIDDLKAWLGGDFDGVIAFDEAHNMGGFTVSRASAANEARGKGYCWRGSAKGVPQCPHCVRQRDRRDGHHAVRLP